MVALLAGAVSVYSQGTLLFNDYNPPVTSTEIMIFGVPTTGTTGLTPVTYGNYTVSEQLGNPTSASLGGNFGNQSTYGSTVYTGSALTGTGYDVQLLAASGSGDALSSLQPAQNLNVSSQGTIPLNGIYTGGFLTSAGGIGNFGPAGLTVVEPGFGGTSISAGAVTLAIAVWSTAGGASTLAAAQQDNNAWGISAPFNVTLATGTTPNPGFPSTFQSFSLGQAATTPEPSTIALGVIGASAFLLRLRRNK